MQTIIITTDRDLRTYVDSHYGLTSDEVDTATAVIARHSDRPAYGSDWSAFLDSMTLDLVNEMVEMYQCRGHEADPEQNLAIGTTIYCDGSCELVRHRAAIEVSGMRAVETENRFWIDESPTDIRPFGDSTYAIVDEQAGGIVAYANDSGLAESIVNFLIEANS